MCWSQGRQVDRSDPGDLLDVSDGHAVLPPVREPGLHHQFQAFGGRAVRPAGPGRQGRYRHHDRPPVGSFYALCRGLGLIIIDEEHEGAYQSELSPRYHAREVAAMRASMNQATLVLGSATPSVESYYKAERGEYGLLTLGTPGREGQPPGPGSMWWILREELRRGKPLHRSAGSLRN